MIMQKQPKQQRIDLEKIKPVLHNIPSTFTDRVIRKALDHWAQNNRD